MPVVAEVSGVATLILADGGAIEGIAWLTVFDDGASEAGHGAFTVECICGGQSLAACRPRLLKFRHGLTARIEAHSTDGLSLSFVTVGTIGAE